MSGSTDAVRGGIGAAEPRFDSLEAGYFDDPYAQYAWLRELNPIYASNRGVVFCFNFDDVRNLLLDPRSTSMDRTLAIPSVAGTKAAPPPTFPLSILNRDRPDHTRLRRLLARAFTPKKIDLFAEWIAREVDTLLDELEREYRETGAPVDLVGGLAFPLPYRVISAMLGMPEGADDQVRSWANDITGASDPIVTREEVATSITGYRQLCDYITADVLPWKRRNPGDDLLTQLLAAEGEGVLSTDELLDNVTLLYVAGHETTSGLISNGVLNLLRHRSQLEQLRADPGLMPNAIEELNRYDSSVQFAWRYVIEDMAVGDQILTPGTMAFVCCGSANRDPDHFGPDADVLDIRRADARDLLSYGAGIHFCLGAPLARQEAALAFEKLLARFPDLELAGEHRWGPRVTFRHLDHLPVTLG